MSKSSNPTPSQINYMERRLAQVALDRASPPTDEEIAQLLFDLYAPDAAVRAAALQRICPCHLAWEHFEPLRQQAKRLQKDPDPTVRMLALNVEQEVEEIATLEAMRDLLEEEEEEEVNEWKQQERKRNKKQRHRQKEI